MHALESSESQQILQSLADREKALVAECEAWYLKYAKPALDRCQTVEEYRCVRQKFPELEDDDGIMDLPGLLSVNLAFELHRIREHEEKL